ncbi:MFS transporter [candidate division KSB1 bacterium]|nr:MFS transporter [candidate division KSB1 bacterium]
MRNFLERTLNIRKGEAAVTLLMLGYIFLVLCIYYLLKPARDALFLGDKSWTDLPYVFILIGIVAVPVNFLHAAASRKFRLNKLIIITFLILASNLILIRLIMNYEFAWTAYVFYIWVSIYGVLVTSQFWLFANAIFTPPQAKRLFVLFGFGAIIGAFAGGEITNILSDFMSGPNLLFVCMGLLLLCIVLVYAITLLKRKDLEERPAGSRNKEKPKESFAQVIESIKSSRHLLLIVGIIGMTMATASFVDVQFKATVQAEFAGDVDGMRAFLGVFYGRLSLVSLLMQLVFTRFVLKRIGVGGIIMFLPLGLILGSAAMFLMPGLIAGVLLRGADGSLKYSIDKTGRELLFLPVPIEVKNRVKIFIDVIVDRWARGLSAGFILLFLYIFGEEVRLLSIAVLAMLVIWMFFIILIRKEYVFAFRKAIDRRDIDPDELRINIQDASNIDSLIRTVKSDNDKQVSYALDMLSSAKDVELTEHLAPLLNHDLKSIRLKALTLLRNQKDDTLQPQMEKLLQEKDPEIQLEAMRYLCSRAGENRMSLIEGYLNQPDPCLKATALICASEEAGTDIRKFVNAETIEALLRESGDESEFCRIQAARAVGNIHDTETRSILLKLIDDKSPVVVREALKSIGRTQDRDFIPVLIKRIGDKNYKNDFRETITAYGIKVVGTLSDYLSDETVDKNVRKHIPAVLSKIPVQESVNVLIANLSKAETPVKYFILKAINKLHENYPELRINPKKVDSVFLDETKTYYEILQILHLHKNDNGNEAAALLRKALEEELDHNLEQIFRVLGLKYHWKDILLAYLGITSDRAVLRDNAIEYLDNILGIDHKKYLLPLLDRGADEIAIKHGRSMFAIKEMTMGDSIEYLILSNNAWLKTCAIYYLKDHKVDNFESLKAQIVESINDANPFVSETAKLVSGEINKLN